MPVMMAEVSAVGSGAQLAFSKSFVYYWAIDWFAFGFNPAFYNGFLLVSNCVKCLKLEKCLKFRCSN